VEIPGPFAATLRQNNAALPNAPPTQLHRNSGDIMRRSLATLAVVSLAGTGSALWATPATAQQGATVHVTTLDSVTYEAGDGQSNDVTITDGTNPGEYVIDDVVPIEPGAGCAHPDDSDPTRVRCALGDPGASHVPVYAHLGDRDDRIDAREASGHVQLVGGFGRDVMTGGPDDEIHGMAGDDTLSGSHRQWGDGGNDTLTLTDGDDYVFGGYGRDTIHGLGGDDHIGGNEGRDEIHGGTGNDHLSGDTAADTLHGGPGQDELYGRSGTDTLHGGAGDDLLDGGKHTDTLDGGPGDDIIRQD
jgi:serralysin